MTLSTPSLVDNHLLEHVILPHVLALAVHLVNFFFAERVNWFIFKQLGLGGGNGNGKVPPVPGDDSIIFWYTNTTHHIADCSLNSALTQTVHFTILLMTAFYLTELLALFYNTTPPSLKGLGQKVMRL